MNTIAVVTCPHCGSVVQKQIDIKTIDEKMAPIGVYRCNHGCSNEFVIYGRAKMEYKTKMVGKEFHNDQ